nr:Chain D, cAMP-dependent protein kinase inhibitor alpha [Homo sapiens]
LNELALKLAGLDINK